MNYGMNSGPQLQKQLDRMQDAERQTCMECAHTVYPPQWDYEKSLLQTSYRLPISYRN